MSCRTYFKESIERYFMKSKSNAIYNIPVNKRQFYKRDIIHFMLVIMI